MVAHQDHHGQIRDPRPNTEPKQNRYGLSLHEYLGSVCLYLVFLKAGFPEFMRDSFCIYSVQRFAWVCASGWFGFTIAVYLVV